ncbi:MAG: hypothetical protein HY519_03795, partial [Candidatus Aenigmarchaeota archaeon]|nr:hypothetical protein [Candidatus Aenigmarchaeota archaeon]
GYAFQFETVWLAAALGRKIAELPIVFREREKGMSKLSAADILEFVWTVMRKGPKAKKALA